MYVIIGGSGFYDFLQDAEVKSVSTPFGKVSFDLGKAGGTKVAFLPRHGKGHSIAPANINYRANIYAAHLLEAEMILTTNAVGSLYREFGPGTIAIPNQILDFTHGRSSTFFDGGGLEVTTSKGRTLSGVVHTDMTHPFDPTVRDRFLASAKELGIEPHDGGTLAVYNGPRYETPAEINAARIMGADFAGMTSAPEAFLARELDLPYATVAVVTNLAAGMQSTISHDEVDAMFTEKIGEIKSLFGSILASD